MKKVFSLLLSFVMVLSIASAVNLFAYADENDTEITEEVTEPAEPTNPVDPEEPTDPVNPEEPTDPVNPEEPTDPVDPEEPTDPNDPEEPIRLDAPAVELIVNDNGTFTMVWNEIDGADKYEIYVLNNSTGKYQLNGTVAKTSATTALAPYGVKYSYKVRAINTENEEIASDFSEVVTGINNKKLATPNLKVAENKNGTFTLSWNIVAGAEKYELCIRNADGSYKLMKTTNSTSFTTAVAVYGKQYSYRMRAVKGKLVSAYSAAVNQKNTIRLQSPALKVTVNKNGTFTLSWNKVAGADKYELYIRQANGSYKRMKTTSANSFTTAVAAYGKKYYYKAKSLSGKNSRITSALGAAANAVNNKKLTAPTGVKAVVNKNGTFTLSWNKVAGADKYEIYIKQANGSYKRMKVTTANSFTTAVAKRGKAYSYKVRAVKNSNSSAASAYSSVVNAKRK